MDSIRNSEDEPMTLDVILAQIREKLADVIEDQDVSRHHWIKVEDQNVADSIIRTYGDSLNRKIIATCLVPHTITDLLKFAGVPYSTGYKKILSLIEDRFLVYYDTIKRDKGKAAKRYVLAIKKLRVDISEDGDARVMALFPERKNFNNIANQGR